MLHLPVQSVWCRSSAWGVPAQGRLNLPYRLEMHDDCIGIVMQTAMHGDWRRISCTIGYIPGRMVPQLTGPVRTPTCSNEAQSA